MEIILKDEVKALGKAGDVVKVSAGYARNYLLPQGIAVKADPKNLKELEHHKRVVVSRQAKLKKAAEEFAKRLSSTSVVIKKEAGEEEKLFGSVAAKDISEALRKNDIVVDRRQIHLESPLRKLGDYEVLVKLHPEVAVNLKVTIVKE